MEKSEKVYKVVSKIMYEKASKFRKKHGNWLVQYCPNRQVVFMDTWNGHIYQAHAREVLLEDDGYVDCQLRGRVHTVVTERDPKLEDAVMIFKTLL